MLIAFTLNMPDRPSVEMLADYYEKSMMIKPAKAFFRFMGKNKFTDADIKGMKQTAALNAADRNPYSWNMEFGCYSGCICSIYEEITVNVVFHCS
jgi:hypothetical protein